MQLPFLVQATGRQPEPAATIPAAAEVLLRWCAEDPDVTSMPYVVRFGGTALSEEEVDELDRAMGALQADTEGSA